MLLKKDQASNEQIQELARNILHRVGKDGTEGLNALQYLEAIRSNTMYPGIAPKETNVVSAADTDTHLLIRCLPNERIYVFDILLSILDITNISFTDSDGNNLLATMYAANAGQGYSHNSYRGKPLKRGKSLLVTSTNAVSYSVDCSYAIIEDPVT